MIESTDQKFDINDPRIAPKFRRYPAGTLAKLNLRALRLSQEVSMNAFAKLLGISRKQLEDIETIRPYGSHITFQVLCDVCDLYDVPLSFFRQDRGVSEVW